MVLVSNSLTLSNLTHFTWVKICKHLTIIRNNLYFYGVWFTSELWISSPKCIYMKYLDSEIHVSQHESKHVIHQFHVMKGWKRRQLHYSNHPFIIWFKILYKSHHSWRASQNNLNLPEIFPVNSLEYQVLKKTSYY